MFDSTHGLGNVRGEKLSRGNRLAFVLAGGLTLAMAGASHATFHVNAVKTDEGATDLVELYFFNDGLKDTGTALEAFELTYSGTPVQFRASTTSPGVTDVDVFNLYDLPNRSWIRVNNQMLTPFQVSPAGSDPAWRSPIGNFQVTYAKLGTTAAPANSGLGAQFARLLIPDGGSFQLNGRVAGNVGNSGLVAFSQNYFITNVAPEIDGTGIVSSKPGTQARGDGFLTRHVTASDVDGILTAFTVTDSNNAAAKGFILDPVGTDAYDVSWNPNAVAPGTYNFSFKAVDSSIQDNSTTTSLLQVVVAPEPASATLAVAGLLAISRRARRR